MNVRKNQGISIITLVITIIVLMILVGVSITGTLRDHEETEEETQISELSIIQHAMYERYTKAQLTKEKLPGTVVEISEVQTLINEIKSLSGQSINLKGTEYKELNASDLEKLGIKKEEDIFIVNYKTGEVINKTQKVTKSGKALYVYSKTEN